MFWWARQSYLHSTQCCHCVQKIKRHHGGYSFPGHVGPHPRTDAKACLLFAQQHSHPVLTVTVLVNLSFISRSLQENVAWLLQTLGHSQIFTSEWPVTQPLSQVNKISHTDKKNIFKCNLIWPPQKQDLNFHRFFTVINRYWPVLTLLWQCRRQI